MAKVKYYAKENSSIGTHSFYAVATAEMLNAANGKSRLGCTVAAKFSRQFSDEVSWQKVDPQAAAAASGEEDITETALAKVTTRAAVRLAGSWRDDLRDVRCKM